MLVLGVLAGLFWTAAKVSVPKLTGRAIDHGIIKPEGHQLLMWSLLIVAVGIISGIFDDAGGSLLVIPLKSVDENLQRARNGKLDRHGFRPGFFQQDQTRSLGRGGRRRARREPFAPSLRIARRHRVTPNDFLGFTSHRLPLSELVVSRIREGEAPAEPVFQVGGSAGASPSRFSSPLTLL